MGDGMTGWSAARSETTSISPKHDQVSVLVCWGGQARLGSPGTLQGWSAFQSMHFPQSFITVSAEVSGHHEYCLEGFPSYLVCTLSWACMLVLDLKSFAAELHWCCIGALVVIPLQRLSALPCLLGLTLYAGLALEISACEVLQVCC